MRQPADHHLSTYLSLFDVTFFVFSTGLQRTHNPLDGHSAVRLSLFLVPVFLSPDGVTLAFEANAVWEREFYYCIP